MHEKVTIKTPAGEVPGIAPLVISASRATDLPAFHANWFMHKLNQGYCAWVNPYNCKQKSFISFSNCRVIVFWSKNPKPLMCYLDDISALGMKYYFQYTVNDYEKEDFEPNIPPINSRIETFIKLSENIGTDKVIWRYDPLLLTKNLSLNEILDRIFYIGEKINQYTEKLIFSFADISNYTKVAHNLKIKDSSARELDKDEQHIFAQKLFEMNSTWKRRLELATCAEIETLPGISRNKCIDNALICKLCPNDTEIVQKYGQPISQLSLLDKKQPNSKPIKNKGQREECGCAPSKDIGAYNTCMHLCAYCYANHSQKAVANNFAKLSIKSESLLS